MTKRDKIKEAYENLGVDWSWMLIFIDFSNGFNFKTDIRITLNTEDLEIVENPIGVMWRPKSLQGIENNNGWIKIESEDDLPKEENVYWCFIDGNVTILNFDFDDNFWKEHYSNLKPTHYKQIQEPIPPIY